MMMGRRAPPISLPGRFAVSSILSMTSRFDVHTEFGEFDLHASVQLAGNDVVVTVGGGKSHVGAIAIAQPRPSLRDSATVSSSSSVFCVVGHKEDMLAKRTADRLAVRLNTTVVVVAGIHWDGLTPNDLEKIDRNATALTDLLAERIRSLVQR